MSEISEGAEATRGSTRLEAFSDGVMAVIITIMAFDLKVPDGYSLHSLGHRLPALAVYVLSFTFIGIYWNNHHHLLRVTPHISGAVMWSNLSLLFSLSLVPVATEWVADDYRHPLPAVAYGTVALCSGFCYTLLASAILRANPEATFIRSALQSRRKELASIALYGAGIALAYVDWVLPYVCYVAVSMIWFIPDRRLSPAPSRRIAT